jgi:hypothetical protein
MQRRRLPLAHVLLKCDGRFAHGWYGDAGVDPAGDRAAHVHVRDTLDRDPARANLADPERPRHVNLYDVVGGRELRVLGCSLSDEVVVVSQLLPQ